MPLQIIATSPDGLEEEITHLDWFAANGVEDWGGDGWTGRWRFPFLLDDEVVFDTHAPGATWPEAQR